MADTPKPSKKMATVLVVEDSSTQREKLRFLLEEAGYAVVGATNGTEGLAAAKANAIDLVISDIVMPEMDGYRLCKALRADPTLRCLPVILLTSLTDPRDVIKGLESGANNFICKPYDDRGLLARVQNVLTNQEIRKTTPSELGISIFFSGQPFLITADRLQILDLLLSTYEVAIQQNRELLSAREEVKSQNVTLERKVRERTADLMAEIADRQRAEKTVRESEEKFRSLFESSRDAIMTLEPPSWRFTNGNPAAVKMFGAQNVQDLVSYGPRDLSPDRQPDGRESADAALEMIETAVREGSGFFEWTHRRLTGEEFPADVRLNRLGQGPRVILQATVRDITERKQAEARMRLQSAALEAAADAIVITDHTGAIEWINPAFSRITGYSFQEAVGKNPRDLVKSGKQSQAFYKEFWDTVLSGRTWHGDMINRRKDGSLYTEALAVTPILDASGAITHFVAIKRDMTEHLLLEAQLRQAQKMESVGQLASGIAHDFNNLLTVINGTSELLLAQVGHDDRAHEDVQEILNAGERAVSLTRQLLAFSRQQLLEPRVLSLDTVVAGMESLLRRLLGEDIDLVVVAAPGVGRVNADPGQLEQVIVNLAVNARDAMPRGGQLTIETENVEIDEASARAHGEVVPPGAYVRLTVSDSGVGMDESTRGRVFEPFFTTKGPGKGTGLGLSTVYGIVRQSRGFIWVYSEVGKGTSLRIYLPQATETASTVQARPTVISSSGTETVLLVEDNVGLRKLAARVLKPAGYTVLDVATAEEALAVLERHDTPVHLLLTDVVMPGMDGRELADRLARTNPALKVLYMSGYTADTVVRHGVLDAHVSFLQKPFSAAVLLRRVREVLDLEPVQGTE